MISFKVHPINLSNKLTELSYILADNDAIVLPGLSYERMDFGSTFQLNFYSHFLVL